MISIAVCDDDEACLKDIFDRLNSYIEKNNIDAYIKKFHSGSDLIDALNRERFDIVFLDIYMEVIDGIQTALKIRETDSTCKIIFLTSSESHAVLSYEVKVNDYLLKPVNDEKLYKTVKIAIESIERSTGKYLVVKTNNGLKKLFFKDILYVESNARVLSVYDARKDKINLYKKLNDFEKELNDLRFFRCHKSFLVNLDFVQEAKDSYFVMETGELISISKKFKDKKKIYIKYLMRNM